MADIKYESKIGQIFANDQKVFAVLSNLENINYFRDLIPQDKVKELEISPDRIRMKVEGLGQKIAIAIVEKEEFKTIKFGKDFKKGRSKNCPKKPKKPCKNKAFGIGCIFDL